MGNQQSKALKPVERAADGKLKSGTPNPGGITREQRQARDALNKWLCEEPQVEKGKESYLKLLGEGNHHIVLDFMNRVAGKVKDVVEHQGDAVPALTMLTREEILAIARGEKP